MPKWMAWVARITLLIWPIIRLCLPLSVTMTHRWLICETNPIIWYSQVIWRITAITKKVQLCLVIKVSSSQVKLGKVARGRLKFNENRAQWSKLSFNLEHDRALRRDANQSDACKEYNGKRRCTVVKGTTNLPEDALKCQIKALKGRQAKCTEVRLCLLLLLLCLCPSSIFNRFFVVEGMASTWPHRFRNYSPFLASLHVDDHLCLIVLSIEKWLLWSIEFNLLNLILI